MKSREDILKRKNDIIEQLKKIVRIFQGLKTLEKDRIANREAICELIMEYRDIMENQESALKFDKNSPKHKKAREEILRAYKEGTDLMRFSSNLKDQIERFRVVIRELNFILGPSSAVE